jgi:hypothetical protein
VSDQRRAPTRIYREDGHTPFGDTRCGIDQRHLLSHHEAEIAGEAMFERWQGISEDGRCDPPPLDMSDAAWPDMFRAAWETIWAMRRGKNGEGSKD